MFPGVIARHVYSSRPDGIGQEFLVCKIIVVIVCILVVLAVIQFFHQGGGRIAQVQGNGQIAGFAIELSRGLQCAVCGIAFRRGGQINSCLREGELAFGIAEHGYGLETGGCQQQCIRVRIANILAGEN